MNELTYKAKLYKMRLVNIQRDFFGNPVSSEDWDKFGMVVEDDLYLKEKFRFKNPKTHTDYGHHYMQCPVWGNCLLAIGKLKKTLDLGIVRIVPRSVIYKVPYLVIEIYSPSFRNPDVLADIVLCGINASLEKYGLELFLEPWESEEPIHWNHDSWISYIKDLKDHPEVGERCMGFEDAVENEKIVKEHLAKKEASKKGKKQIKSDRIEDYIRLPHKEKIVRFLKEKTKGLNIQKDIARPFRFLYDHGITHHIPYKAVIKAIPEIHLKIRESRYNDWTNIQRTSYDGDPKYKDLEKEIESVLQSDDSLN